MSTTQALLEVRNITHRFSGFAALKNVNFSLQTGSVHALVGENGAGKSTLVKAISGIIQPTEGEILLDGTTVQITPATRKSLGISIVSQHVELFPHLTLAENIFMDDIPRRGPFIDRGKLRDMTAQWFDRFGLPFSPNTPMRELSFVQQKILTILKALKDNGRIIILDEPTASLHTAEIEQLFSFIREFNAKGVAFIYISHHLQEIFDICDTVSVLRDGIMQGSFPVTEIDLPRLVSSMVGENIEQGRSTTQKPRSGRTVLEVKGLCGAKVVNDASFSLNAGEILGIVSNRGSGKNELVEALFGITRAKSGSIEFDGKRVELSSPRKAMDLTMMLLPEDRHRQGLFLDKSIVENITAANLPSTTNRMGLLNPRREESIAEKHIRDLSIACAGSSQNARFLSGGNQQKVMVGKVLQTAPRVILLDSPTVGVDIKARADIHRLVRKLAESGISVIVFSSDLEEIVLLCDRVLVLSRGQLTREILPGDVNFNIRDLGILIEGGDVCS